MRYTITLAYEDKEYTFQDTYDYQGWDAERDADYRVTWMYTEGDFGCDCNRSDFLYQYCNVDFRGNPRAELDTGYTSGEVYTLPCGDTITLVSIKDGDRVVWPEPPSPMPPVYVQRQSGLYVPESEG